VNERVSSSKKYVSYVSDGNFSRPNFPTKA
jgi:hypothetical protein